MIIMTKNILYRMFQNKAYLIISLVFTPIVIFFSIYFSTNLAIKGNIAVVNIENLPVSRGDFKITYLDEKPKLSELVKDKYDAVIYKEDGNFKIDTVKVEKFRNTLESALKGEDIATSTDNKRGVTSNIIGFITMLIIIQGVTLYKFYYKEKGGIAKRILSSNLSNEMYVFSHFMATFIMLFSPVATITLVAKEVLKIDTIVSGMELTFIIFILCLFAATFGLIISVCVKSDENAMMVGSMATIITTLLSGSFFEISDNKVVELISYIFPQKHILDFTIALENGNKANIGIMIIIIIASLLIVMIGAVINKNKIQGVNC